MNWTGYKDHKKTLNLTFQHLHEEPEVNHKFLPKICLSSDICFLDFSNVNQERQPLELRQLITKGSKYSFFELDQIIEVKQITYRINRHIQTDTTGLV